MFSNSRKSARDNISRNILLLLEMPLELVWPQLWKLPRNCQGYFDSQLVNMIQKYPSMSVDIDILDGANDNVHMLHCSVKDRHGDRYFGHFGVNAQQDLQMMFCRLEDILSDMTLQQEVE